MPEPVPPEITMFFVASTHTRRKFPIGSDRLPNPMRSSTWIRFFGNLRIVIVGLSSASGGMMAWTREPSGRRASTVGLDSSIRRPIGPTMRSIAVRISFLPRNDLVDFCRRPLRSM